MLQTLTLEKPASKIFSNFGVKISKTKSALPYNISQSRPCFSHVLKSVCHSRVCAAVSIIAFSCCKQERRRRKGGIAQENAEV